MTDPPESPWQAPRKHTERAGELLANHIESITAQREQASAIRHL